MHLSGFFHRTFLTQVFHVYLGLLAFSIQWEKSRGAQKSNMAAMTLRDPSTGPLKCYSCQAETKDDECYKMNNTDFVNTQECAPEQIYCKVSNFTAADQFRYINRTCSDQCNTGCIPVAASGDFVPLNMCYYCCSDNLCNTPHTSNAKSLSTLMGFLILCFIALTLHS